MASCQAGIAQRLADLHESVAIPTIHPVAPSAHVDDEDSDSFVERRLLNGRHGTIWTIFPVRKSSVFFSIGKPGFSSVSSRASRSSY